MVTHSSVLAWRIPGEPGGQPAMGSHRVGHDWSDLAAAAAAPVLSEERWPEGEGLSRMETPWHSRLHVHIPSNLGGPFHALLDLVTLSLCSWRPHYFTKGRGWGLFVVLFGWQMISKVESKAEPPCAGHSSLPLWFPSCPPSHPASVICLHSNWVLPPPGISLIRDTDRQLYQRPLPAQPVTSMVPTRENKDGACLQPWF